MSDQLADRVPVAPSAPYVALKVKSTRHDSKMRLQPLLVGVVLMLTSFILVLYLTTVYSRQDRLQLRVDHKLYDRILQQQTLSTKYQGEVRVSESGDIALRSQFQKNQVKKYCSAIADTDKLYHWPEGKGQPEELYRHLLFDDVRKSIFCFVEKNGCTNMKRLMFVSVGQLPVNTSQAEWVDLKYLERGIRHASFLNKTLTEEGRMKRLTGYYKFTIVRNPLERLVSSYRNKIEPPLSGGSLKFPNYIKRQIFEMFRPVVYQHWLESGGNYNISITFSEFVEYFIESFKDHLNPHIKPFTRICHPCNIPYDFFGHFKHYSRDVKMVIHKLGMNRSHYHDKSLYSSKNDSTAYLLEAYYQRLTRMQRARLYDVMRDELLFYYHLFPGERHSHHSLLGIDEELYQVT